MRYLLDTNVISEVRKGDRADANVQRWWGSVESEELALSVLVVGEIQLGIARLRRRDPVTAGHLEAWSARLQRAFNRRILPVELDVVEAWARLNAVRSLPVVDSLQAATAKVHGLTLVTRNTADLEGVRVPMLDPFTG